MEPNMPMMRTMGFLLPTDAGSSADGRDLNFKCRYVRIMSQEMTLSWLKEMEELLMELTSQFTFVQPSGCQAYPTLAVRRER